MGTIYYIVRVKRSILKEQINIYRILDMAYYDKFNEFIKSLHFLIILFITSYSSCS